MQRLRGLRARWTRSTGRGLCWQRQAQPVRELQTPSLNLATWKSGNAGMKPCSLDPAPPPAALRGCPRYPGLPQAPARAARGGPGCFADRLVCAPPQPPRPCLASTLSTELFISSQGCYGARHYGSRRPGKHLFAQLPGGFLKNCFPRSAAGSLSHVAVPR